MALNLGLCPCCVPPVALSFLSAALVVVVSARMFFPRQGKVGKLLKFLTWSCVAMNVAMAGFLVALKSNKDLQDSFFSKLCLKLSSDPAMLPPRCERLGLSTKLAGLNVIEFGPGPGTTFKCFEKGGAPKSWVGIEPNAHFREMQDEAAKHLDASMIRSTRWYKAETLELDVASGTFDAAYFTHVLCSVEDPAMVLQQAARALKPGGTLLLMEHVAAPEGTPLRYLQKTLAPILEIVGNGCQWRDTEKILRASWDFEDLRVEPFSADAMPLPFRPHILATATKRQR